VGLDQFGEVLVAQPAFTWSVSGGGTIGGPGVFTAGSSSGGPYQITASTGTFSASASINITGQTLIAWQTAHFSTEEIAAGKADAAFDFDSDGHSNLLEYALGADPRVPASFGNLDVAVRADSEAIERLTLTFARPTALPGVTYTIEVSGDLKTWSIIPSPEVISKDDSDVVTGRDPLPATGAGQRFIRLRINRTTP
jgi:hypothetical protein